MSLEPFDNAILASLRACGITKVFPDPANPAHLRELASATAAVGLQIEYLCAAGHRRFGLAATMDPRLVGLNEQRLESARRTARRLGLAPPEVQVVGCLGDSGPQAVRAWIAAGVTAVVAYNDVVAAAVVGSALRAGLCVPGDLSVIGHGDSPLASQFLPALSSVRIDLACRIFATARIGGRNRYRFGSRPHRAGHWIVGGRRDRYHRLRNRHQCRDHRRRTGGRHTPDPRPTVPHRAGRRSGLRTGDGRGNHDRRQQYRLIGRFQWKLPSSTLLGCGVSAWFPLWMLVHFVV